MSTASSLYLLQFLRQGEHGIHDDGVALIDPPPKEDFRGPRGREGPRLMRSKRKRPRPEEVVEKLRQAGEALANGMPIAEVARSPVVSEVTFDRWRAE